MKAKRCLGTLGLVWWFVFLVAQAAPSFAEELGCDCTIVPFNPSPPCFSACSTKSLEKFSIGQLQDYGLTAKQSLRTRELLVAFEAPAGKEKSESLVEYLKGSLDSESFVAVLSVMINQELEVGDVDLTSKRSTLGHGFGSVLGVVGGPSWKSVSRSLQKDTRDWFRYQAMLPVIQNELSSIEYAKGDFYITLGAIHYEDGKEILTQSSLRHLDRVVQLLPLFRGGELLIMEYHDGEIAPTESSPRLAERVESYLMRHAPAVEIRVNSGRQRSKYCPGRFSTHTAYICEMNAEAIRLVIAGPRFKRSKSQKDQN